MNKFFYLVLTTLHLSKTVIYDFWYDYVEPIYDKNAKPFCRDRDKLRCSCKNMKFIKILQKMLRQDFTDQTNRPLPKGKMKK